MRGSERGLTWLEVLKPLYNGWWTHRQVRQPLFEQASQTKDNAVFAQACHQFVGALDDCSVPFTHKLCQLKPYQVNNLFTGIKGQNWKPGALWGTEALLDSCTCVKCFVHPQKAQIQEWFLHLGEVGCKMEAKESAWGLGSKKWKTQIHMLYWQKKVRSSTSTSDFHKLSLC